MKNLTIFIFTYLSIFANTLHSATWEDFKANAKDAKFVFQHYIYDGGSISYEFEYIDEGKPESVFITDRKSKFVARDSRNIYVDIATRGKHSGDNGFELKDESDKEFIIDFLLRFADYKEIHDTLKFLGKEVEKAPTKDHPEEIEERSKKIVEKILKENKEKRIEAKKRVEEEFNFVQERIEKECIEKDLAFIQAKKEAVELAVKLIKKLESNTRFNQEDEKFFFGGINNFYSNTLSFYKRNGYIEADDYQNGKDFKFTEKKPLPPYSFFGETLRLNRNVFLTNYSNLPFISVVEYYVIDENSKPFVAFSENFVSLEIYPRTPKREKIRLEYFAPKKFFLEEIVIDNKDLFTQVKKKNSNFEETMHAYVSTEGANEPKLVRFLEEHPKIASYISTSTENNKNISDFFNIKDKDEEIFVVLSCLERLIDDRYMPEFRYKNEYNEKLACLYSYILEQKDGVIPYGYAEIFFKSLKSEVNHINRQQEEFDIACLEKILGKNPSGYTRDFYLKNRDKPDFKAQKQKLLQNWEDFYNKYYK